MQKHPATTTASYKKTIINGLIFAMGIAYMFFLIWAILWKCGTLYIGNGSERAVNWLPFNNNANWEMQLNIAVFIPFGFYLSAVKREWTLLKRVLAVLITSLSLEVLQFALAIGRSDITDLLLNTLGGAMGIALFYLLSKAFGKNERKATLVICIFLTAFEMYMTASFIFFGQLNLGFMILKLS